jgi:hypothetical protein
MSTRFSFQIQSALSKESIEAARERNLNWAKNYLLGKGGFEASVWIYTDGMGSEPQNVYYIVTSPEIVEEMKESPLNQIAPLVKMFLGKQEEHGKIIAYQVVSECWMKSFSQGQFVEHEYPPIEWGDMAKMANREEVFIEQYVRPGYDVESQAFEIIRDEDSDDVKELRYMEDMSRMIQTEKLLPLPMEGKRNE